MQYILIILLLIIGCNPITEEVVEYHPSGKKKVLIKYHGKKNDRKILGSFYYLEDGTEFNTISYDDNGRISAIHQMNKEKQKPNGRSIRFDKNNRIISESNYKNGKLDGEWTIYTPDGRIMSKTYWENGEKIK